MKHIYHWNIGLEPAETVSIAAYIVALFQCFEWYQFHEAWGGGNKNVRTTKNCMTLARGMITPSVNNGSLHEVVRG